MRSNNSSARGHSGKEVKREDNFLEDEGVIEELLPATTFKVRLGDGRIVSAYLSGKMRLNRIRLLPGDKVRLEMSPYDLSKARIVYRY